MTRLLWIMAWIAVAIWSLFAWAAYGVLDLFGGLASRNADAITGHPETVEWLSWAFSFLRGLGQAAVLLVWGGVSLAILAVPFVLGRIFRLGGMAAAPGGPRRPYGGTIDLDPGEYQVGPQGSHRPPEVPFPPRRLEDRR